MRIAFVLKENLGTIETWCKTHTRHRWDGQGGPSVPALPSSCDVLMQKARGFQRMEPQPDGDAVATTTLHSPAAPAELAAEQTPKPIEDPGMHTAAGGAVSSVGSEGNGGALVLQRHHESRRRSQVTFQRLANAGRIVSALKRHHMVLEVLWNSGSVANRSMVDSPHSR